MKTRAGAYEIPSYRLAQHFASAPLDGGLWCDECGCSTNHTTAQHRAAEPIEQEEC